MRRKGFYFTVVFVFFLFFTISAFTPQARAAYPEQGKVIEFLHHSSAGGGVALFLLSTADILNKTGIVKAKIQVQSRPGGSSAVALNYLKSKAGDPYVVMMWSTSQLMAMLRGSTQMKLDECTWLSVLVETPNAMVVPYDSPYKNLNELIADAKANPKKVNVGVNSIGGSEHLIAARIERAAGVKFNITSFEFSPTALLGGHINVAFGNTSETLGHVKAKRIRVLASTAEHRMPAYKDVPTMIEQGVKASFTQLQGFFGGPGFPTEAYNFWQGSFEKLSKSKEFIAFEKKADFVPVYKNGAETKAFLVDYVKGLQEDLKYIEASK